jgi:CPA1 family monovalent cation:H+ antiporter
MTAEATFFVLLLITSIVAMLARYANVPYTVALVVAGLALRAVPKSVLDLDALRLTPDLLFQVFLPLLLFEAAFHLSWKKFRANVRAILLLAVPGVVASVALGGIFAFLLEPLTDTPMTLLVAMLFSAMLASTDPVSVIALFKEVGVIKRLAVIVEGESLLNDAVSVVSFIVISALLGLSQEATEVTPIWLVRFLLWEVCIGVLAGLCVGLLVSWITTIVHDHLVEIMLTTIAAFGAYVAAKSVHASPVLAVVASGMACGNVGARFGMTASNRIAVESFWEYAVFVANGFLFILLGKEIDVVRMLGHIGPIIAAWVALTVSRLVVIKIVEVVLSKTEEKLPERWWGVLVWGGIRGSVSMVLALTIPATYVHRDLLVDLTFGVVLMSILVQGLSIVPVLKWAGVMNVGSKDTEYLKLRTALRAVREAMRRLEEENAIGAMTASTFELMSERLAARESALEAQIARLEKLGEAKTEDEIRRVERQLGEVERQIIRRALESQRLPDQAAKSLLDEIATRPSALDETKTKTEKL